MPLIDHIDGPNRYIYLHLDSVGVDIHPMDIYKEMRTLRATDESLRKYDVFLSAFGNVDKGGGTATERYVVENLGTRIIPYDQSQKLTIIGTIITDDGQQGRDCFDRSPLTPGVEVDIDYQPPQVEIITVSTGSGLSPEQEEKLSTIDALVEELHRLQGLNDAFPLTVTPTQRSTGDIDQTISGDGENVTVVTRN